MRALIFMCCLAAIKAATVQEECKEGLNFDGKYYEQEVVKKDLDRPYQMVVDRKNNTLYFSYSVGTKTDDYFKSASINLTDNKFIEIKEINNGFAAAAEDKGIVYLGGSDGIYIVDREGKMALHTDKTEKNIWVLFFKDYLYYIDYPDQKLYVYNNGSTLVPEFAETTITQFAIDKDGERFFANDTGLFGLEKNCSIDKAKLYESKVVIRGITLNKEGKAYFCGENGVYTLDKEHKIKHVALINDLFGLAFDNNDRAIYATSDKIIKLIPSTKNCTITIPVTTTVPKI